MIIVRLFAGLETRTRERRRVWEVPVAEAPTLASLGVYLGLAAGVTGLTLVNGVHATPAQQLRSGDEVSLFPPLGGG